MRWVVAMLSMLVLAACGSDEEEAPPEDDTQKEGDSCLVSEGCESPFFCAADGCIDSTQGTCISTAELDCSNEPESPVCGCDGETYASRCEAHSKRRNIEFNAACSNSE